MEYLRMRKATRMVQNFARVVATGGLSAGFALGALAQSDDEAPLLSNDDVRELLKQMQEQRTELDALKSEISEMKAAEGEKWLTEARAKEIRALVSEVLSDADNRVNLLQDGLTAGWDDHFFLASQDGRFAMELLGQFQFREIWSWRDQLDRNRQGFEIPRANLTFRGHVFSPDLNYLIRMEQTRNEPNLVNGLFFLQDAWVRYQLNNDWSIRFGQFKVPFNREELVGSEYQLASERSLLNESLNLGRTQGFQVTWAGEHARVISSIGDGAEDNIGGFGLIDPGGNPKNAAFSQRDVEIAVSSRAEWKLYGTWDQFVDFTSTMGDSFGVLVGVAGHFQTGERGTFGTDEEDWYAYSADVSVEFGGANLYAAWIHHYIESPNLANVGDDGVANIYGLVLQGGYYITPKWEVFARYEWGQFLTNATTGRGFRRDGTERRRAGVAFKTLSVPTIGVNYYLEGHDAKWTTDIGVGINEIDTAWDSDLAGYRSENDHVHQIVFRTQFQLLF